jgi:DNA-binding NarL/FixJ family response regulator
MMNKIKVILVEDHEIFRMGLRELINQEKDLSVCAETDNAADAMLLIKTHEPAMVIVDITLKNSNGIDLLKQIRKSYPKIFVLMLSMYDEGIYAERSLNAGASGYIMKHETSVSIIHAIRHILKGNIYISEKINENILNRMVNKSLNAVKLPVDTLSDRELEIFRHIGNGRASSDIAKELNLSIKTVGTYRERIKEKLNIKTASDLQRYAIHWVETGNES